MAGGKFSHGYKSYENSPASRVGLPEKVKCVRCSKVKILSSNFSGKRQNDLQEEIRKKGRSFDPIKTAFIACNLCTGGQVFEFKCNQCGVTKSRDSFSKAQLRNPDKAECWPCLQDRLNTEADGSDDDYSNSDSGGTNESSDSEYGGGSTMAGTFSNMSITNGAPSSATGGVALSYAAASSTTAPTPTPSVNNSALTGSLINNFVPAGLPPGFNPNAYGAATPPHLRARKAPDSLTGSDVSTAASKFAKVKAGPRKFDSDDARRVREKYDKPERGFDEVTVQDSESSDTE